MKTFELEAQIKYRVIIMSSSVHNLVMFMIMRQMGIFSITSKAWTQPRTKEKKKRASYQ